MTKVEPFFVDQQSALAEKVLSVCRVAPFTLLRCLHAHITTSIPLTSDTLTTPHLPSPIQKITPPLLYSPTYTNQQNKNKKDNNEQTPQRGSIQEAEPD
jgi:hypothetical protein